jgi:hypothetical protein
MKQATGDYLFCPIRHKNDYFVMPFENKVNGENEEKHQLTGIRF